MHRKMCPFTGKKYTNVFSKQGDDWQINEGEGAPVKDEIEKITSTLSRLTVQSAESTASEKTDYELTVKAAGDTLHYRFFKEGGNHFVSRADYSQGFKINKFDYEKITGQTSAQLVKYVEMEEEHTGADTAPNENAQNQTTPETENEVVPKENS